jgi:hypothetical protein
MDFRPKLKKRFIQKTTNWRCYEERYWLHSNEENTKVSVACERDRSKLVGGRIDRLPDPGTRRSPLNPCHYFTYLVARKTDRRAMQRSEIWYSDGSLILQVENTQFRVHWSVLALNSSFFRNLQGLPQPPDQPRVEGCPIIELHDSLEDVEYLLKALYNP